MTKPAVFALTFMAIIAISAVSAYKTTIVTTIIEGNKRTWPYNGLDNGRGYIDGLGLDNGQGLVDVLDNGQGLVDGLDNGQGLVDVLDNGQGLVDGLENGQGLVDGLYNGQGLVDGLYNGQGLVDGLENGQGLVDGLYNGQGLVDGLENGQGLVDGLDNGQGLVDGLDNNPIGSQQCRSQVPIEQVNHCKMHLTQGIIFDKMAVRPFQHHQEQHIQQCCSQLKQLSEQCQCAAIQEAFSEAWQQKGGLQKVSEIASKAYKLPNDCGLQVQECLLAVPRV